MFHRFLLLPITIVALSITIPRTKTRPSCGFVEKVARAADPSNATEDYDEEEEWFTDLVLGGKTSGLDDLSYSDDDDDYNDEDYDNGMDEEVLRIEYSDRNNFRHGRCQTNFIPGGPQPPIYDGMSANKMAFVKSEFRKVRKKTPMACGFSV